MADASGGPLSAFPSENSSQPQPDKPATWSHVVIGKTEVLVKILDEKGFCIAFMSAPAVLHDYAAKLQIQHWNAKPGESYRQYPAEEQIANARLMAAAPQMLDALRKCSTLLGHVGWFFCSEDGNSGDIFKLVNSAIAKAEGGQ
jgi:hypothetical protein